MKTIKQLLALAVLLCYSAANARPDFTKVDRWLAQHAPQMGGRLFLVLYKDGRKVYSHGENQLSGRQRLLLKRIATKQGKTPDYGDYTADTKQPIASCSKWLSAALVMTFVDEGKLSLNDTVGKFLPVLSAHGKGGITITQCLSHLTGIRSPDLKEDVGEIRQAKSMDEVIGKIALLPMEGKPGRVFRYSNTGLQIAGAVIEKIGRKPFQALFDQRIARPLEMTGTDFGSHKVAMPAGGAVSTPDDYMKFLVMILNQGLFKGKRILSENSIAQMQVNRISSEVQVTYKPEQSGALGYGFGEWIMPARPDRVTSSSVSSPGLFGSYPWVDNQNETAGFLMAFYLDHSHRAADYQELRALVNDALQ
ncbi:MAG: serine hydrolase domain-containing protein [Dyadobacter sp.]|uniref:serine hydrolase domain-containing protein n=1 Tax=Dyadobacter sp. TaxID=1914288 RepID=UPI003264E8D4